MKGINRHSIKAGHRITFGDHEWFAEVLRNKTFTVGITTGNMKEAYVETPDGMHRYYLSLLTFGQTDMLYGITIVEPVQKIYYVGQSTEPIREAEYVKEDGNFYLARFPDDQGNSFYLDKSKCSFTRMGAIKVAAEIRRERIAGLRRFIDDIKKVHVADAERLQAAGVDGEIYLCDLTLF